MKRLDHIETPKTDWLGCKYFVTITLPASMNRKGVKRQKEYFDNYFKAICDRCFSEAYGAYEFTKKGNLHIHIVCDVNEFFVKFPFVDAAKREEANILQLKLLLKERSYIDVQAIKVLDNVYKYITKDILVTQAVLEKSPYLRYKSETCNIDLVQTISQEQEDAITSLDLNSSTTIVMCNKIECDCEF